MELKFKDYICDQCGVKFEAPQLRVYEDSDVVFCRKKCYLQFLDEWEDVSNPELMAALPGKWDNE